MMDDSGFLRDLARTAREEAAEEQQRWDRWDRLADGDLSPEEEAELEALAATSAEDKMAFEAFRPLGSDFRARMAEKFVQIVGNEAAFEETNKAVEPPVPRVPPRVDPVKETHGWLTSSWWRAGFLGSGLTTATIMLYLIFRVPLPPFTIADLQSNVEIYRGEKETPAPVLLLDTDFSVLARPADKLPLEKKLETSCYIRSRSTGGGKLRDADCSVLARNARTGAPKIGGHLPADLPTGPATIWIVLAYSGKLPAPDVIENLPSDRSTNHQTWVAEPAQIEIRAP